MRKLLAGVALGLLAALLGAAEPATQATTQEAGYTALFNGKDLTGWTQQAKATWTVEDGAIVGKPIAGAGSDAWLFTETEWSDFVLELDFKMTEHVNSGIALRMPKGKTGDPDMNGFEMQICNVPKMHPTGSLLHHIDTKENNEFKQNEWTHLKITCEGEHMVIFMNDLKMLDTKQRGPKTGRIGMQVAKGKEFADMVAQFKNIKVKSLVAEASAPATGK